MANERGPIAIVIPAHNAASTIGEQLGAIRSQDSTAVDEVIVVDSVSTDETRAVVERFAATWTKLRLVTAPGSGANTARNCGIGHSTAAGVLLCDADDVVASGWVEEMRAALERHDVVYGSVELNRLNDAATIAARGSVESSEAPVAGSTPGGLGANCGFRRHVWIQLGGLLEHHYGCDDAEFLWRARLAGYDIAVVPDATVHYRLRPDMGSLFRQQRQWASGRALLYKEFGPFDLIDRPRIGLAVKTWVWLGVHVPDVRSADPARRGRWVRTAAHAVGRVQGSIRHRVVYL